MNKPPFHRAIYVISDDPSVLIQAVDDGATIVQLRDKTGSGPSILAKARTVLAHKAHRPFTFILNDDPAMALEAGADGVHIGQDTATAPVRALLGPDRILGKTTHGLAQARQAEADGADYISVGPVFATPTKPGRPAVGLTYVQEAAGQLSIPFVAIGGIDGSNLDAVLKAGARTIGIVRAAGDTRALLARIRA